MFLYVFNNLWISTVKLWNKTVKLWNKTVKLWNKTVKLYHKISNKYNDTEKNVITLLPKYYISPKFIK